jgi:hypothetical protein
MEIDRQLFGTYPAFSIQQYFWPIFDTLTVGCYRELPSVLTLVFFITLFADQTLFRKYLLNLIIAMIPGFYFWYLLPAISPEEMFRKNMLAVQVSSLHSPEILTQLRISPFLGQLLDELSSKWSNPALHRLSITCFPSMHLAWGMIVCNYAIKAAKWLGFIFVPFCFFNSIGTVYTLQHYTIDLIPGAIIGALSIILVDRMVDWDNGRGYDREIYFSFITAIHSDFRRILRFVGMKRTRE